MIFRDGETNKTLTIPISGSGGRPSKSFRVALQSPTGGAGLGANPEATVTLTDDHGLVGREFLETQPDWKTESVWA